MTIMFLKYCNTFTFDDNGDARMVFNRLQGIALSVS